MYHFTTAAKIAAALLLPALFITGCAGTPPTERFAPCPSSPNCVSSLATDEEHTINGFRLTNEQDWQCLLKQADALKGEHRVAVTQPDYTRIEYVSALLGFVDDLELKKSDNEAQVRSASRVGHSDFGVNRTRVFALHSAYQQACVKP